MTDDRPIVVGTDGSETSRRAVEWAADDAALRNRPLVIVYAVEQWTYGAAGLALPETAEALEREGRRILANARDLATARRPGVPVTTELVFEAPVAALRAYSERAFEIVLGHRGLGGFTSLLLGSVGLGVAGHCGGPVVIVRDEQPPPQGRIVAGVDLSDDSAAALAYAFETAAGRGAALRVVYAWRLPPTLLQSGYTIDVEDVEATVRRELGKVCVPWRERHPGVEVVEEIAHDHPVRVLTEASSQADLVVVGARRRTGLHAVRLGSVSHGLVHHAHCPVAVVRPVAGGIPGESRTG
ncbi:universal stress protein [Actinomadura craniellae]|uniref:Universal stress protein n=1 Tax=Actinomadura craniellae TaxID=2231787 RepID=A0A365GZK9_9ACTN|nr:universal stress protein [Actinomadura craniellae]RAY12275.1 universal stress protein [Actinomadura craniellae]